MIRDMDAYDSEPFLDLLPRRWLRLLGYAALAALIASPAARLWLVDQAESHVLHEVQPMIDNLVQQVEPASTFPTD